MHTLDKFVMTVFLLMALLTVVAINTKGRTLAIIKWIIVALCVTCFALMIAGVWLGCGPFGWGGTCSL